MPKRPWRATTRDERGSIVFDLLRGAEVRVRRRKREVENGGGSQEGVG